MGIIHAYVQAAEEFAGAETQAWNSKACIFLWLLFHVKMLIMGPKREESDELEETINTCVARRLNLFRCGHIGGDARHGRCLLSEKGILYKK